MAELNRADLRNLVRFRYAIRRLQRLSENAARAAGLTPHQHQLLLGIAGLTDETQATIGALAEFLQLRHHSVVGLVDRAQELGLVRRHTNPADRRQVFVTLTAAGARKLKALEALHRKELRGLRRTLDLLDVEGLAPSATAAARTRRRRPPPAT